LQAYNAADQYLIETVTDTIDTPLNRVLIINDNFGALACFCEAQHITWVSDSFVATKATQINLELNDLSPNIEYKNMLQPITGEFDLVLIRIPKNLSMLEYQLAILSNVVSSKTKVIAAGMCKDIHNSSIRLFERYLGPSPSSLAKKKARLIQPTGEFIGEQALPKACSWTLEGYDFQISNHASVFSREQLDIGARFFLEHIPSGNFKHIIDLGCGNGVIGLASAIKNPQAQVSCVDESQMAVQSAKDNFTRNLGISEPYQFIQDNCLSSFDASSADLVLCNPPFHQQNTISDHIAWQMFNDAKKVLQSGGILRIIGNRHLAYQAKLKRIFGNCTQVAANRKFVILESVK